jgi:hypothetical protein
MPKMVQASSLQSAHAGTDACATGDLRTNLCLVALCLDVLAVADYATLARTTLEIGFPYAMV